MLITCPSCASAYDLPADRIGPEGRRVRCAKCRGSWFVPAPGAKPRLDVDGPPDLEIVARALGSGEPGTAPVISRARPGHRRARNGARAAAPMPGQRRPGFRLAATAALALVLGGLVLGRAAVVARLPGTAAAYAAIGLPVNVTGLDFAAVRSVVTREGGTAVLEVAGEIRNVGRGARPVPPLSLRIEGDGQEELYAWSARVAEGELPAGETVPFRVRLAAPPPAGKRVEVRFRERGEGRVVALR